MTDELGPQLNLYFSRGLSPIPKINRAGVLLAYGATSLERVEKLAEEVGSLTLDWAVHDLASGTEWAIREMRHRHPDLDEQSARALGWAFSYWNK